MNRSTNVNKNKDHISENIVSVDSGMIGADGIIEIKCSFSGKEMNPDEAIKEKKILYWKCNKNGEIVLNERHPFYYQVQGQLNITERDYCYFAVWTGRH